MLERDQALQRLSDTQHGVVSIAQAQEVGFSARTIRYRTEAGTWISIHPRVFAPGSHYPGWHGQLLAACMWAKGGVASHTSAGTLWGLPGCDKERIEITVARCHLAPRSGIRVHFTDRLLPGHITQLAGIPVTSIERTLLDLCAVLPELTAAMAIDDALRRRLTSIKLLDTLVGEVAKRGRRGCGILRRLIREREGLPATPHSPLETRFFQLVRRSSLPMPVCQHVIRNGSRFVARVDFAFPEAKLAVECQSKSWHSSKDAREADLARLAKLSDLGWTVEFVTDEEMRNYATSLINRLWQLYSKRAA